MTTRDEFIKILEDNPIIVAIKEIESIEKAIKASSQIIFLLTSNLFSIQEEVKQLQANGKVVFVHFDLVDGLSKNYAALKYIAESVRPDGIISTKPTIISAAKKLGLLTVQRHFVVDSISLASSIDAVKETKPDAVEILPGLVYKSICEMKDKTQSAIIAGGLISEKEEIIHCINAGVAAISTSCERLWDI